MASLPAEVLYGTVTAQLFTAEIDSIDADLLPEGVPVAGTVTIKPSAQALRDSVGKAIILPKPMTYNLDAEGNLISPDGTIGVTLIASDSPSIQPLNFTYNVSFDLVGTTLSGFNFYLPNGETLDLSEVAQVSPDSGAYFVVGPQGIPGPQGIQGPPGTYIDPYGSSLNLSHWGTSVALGNGDEGVGSNNWGSLVAADLGLTYSSFGLSGRTSTEIAIRQGGIDPVVNVAGNSIPAATTPVTITIVGGKFAGQLVTQALTGLWRKATSWTGTLAGVVGVLTKDDTGSAWTFTRSVAGSAVAAAPGSVFHCTDGDARLSDFQLFNAFENNWTLDPGGTVAIRDMDAMIAHLPPGHLRYVIVGNSTQYGKTATGSDPVAQWVSLSQTDSAALARYGKRFANWRLTAETMGIKLAGIAPTSDDLNAPGNDAIPPSLLNVGPHPNATGYEVMRKLATQTARIGGLIPGQVPVFTTKVIPTTPALGSATLSSLTVTLAAVTGATSYVVYYRKTGSLPWLFISTTSLAPVLTGLDSGTSYDVYVEPWNIAGAGRASAIAAGSTTGTPPTLLISDSFLGGRGFSSLSATASSDLITKTAHGLVANQPVELNSITGAAGLVAGQLYYVLLNAANNFKLSLTPDGSPVDITSDGTVTVFVLDSTPQATIGGRYADNLVPIPAVTIGPVLSRAWASSGTTAINAAGQLYNTAGVGKYNLIEAGGGGTLDMRVRLKIDSMPAGSDGVTLLARAAELSSMSNGFKLRVGSDGSCTVSVLLGGSGTQIGGAFTPSNTVKAGSIVEFAAVGTLLSLYVDGVFIRSITDTVGWSGQSQLGTGLALAAAGDTVTKTAHGLSNGQCVKLSANTATGVADGTLYYVVGVTTNTFQLSLTPGGAAVDITADGTATVNIQGNRGGLQTAGNQDGLYNDFAILDK